MSNAAQSFPPNEIVGALRDQPQREYGPVSDMPLRMLLLVEQLKEAEKDNAFAPAQ
jgi:hypothetical protein